MKTRIFKLTAVLMAAIISVLPLQASAAKLAEATQPSVPIPMLASLEQISQNQLRIRYDRPVDIAKGTTPGNYWVQSTNERIPSNIATLGMNDSVSSNNALTASKVQIRQADNQGQTFVLTFSQNIAKGMAFKLIICYVTAPGQPPYSGDNGSASFVGQ